MSETQLAVSAPVRASDQLAGFLGIEKGMMLDTLKAQCFKGKRPEEVSDAQLAAFVSTANALQVNPLLPGFLYAYPERNGGITPILGPDGVFKKLDEFIASGKLRGYECEVKMGADGKPVSAHAIIHRTGDQIPAKYDAYYSEWAVTSNPNWQARPRHMLWVRAIKQAARQVIHGLPMDADEYEIQQMQNVTPEAEAPKVDRPAPPKREKKGAQKAADEKVVDAVVEDVPPQQAEAPKTESAAPAEKKADPAPVEEKKPEPVKEAPKQEVQQARAFLKDKEEVTVEVTVSEVSPLNIKTPEGTRPSIQAVLKGGYVGTVYHIGGGVTEGDQPRLAAPWAQGAVLKLKLQGKLNSKVNKVQVFVQSVEAVGAEAAEMEV